MHNTSVWNYIKWGLTAFIALLIPTYWHYYGPQNFLWGSDIGLFLTVLALWMHSPLVMSIAFVGIVVMELLWAINFFTQLFLHSELTGISNYMFDSSYPLVVRALSLFHIFVPVIWLFYTLQYGYQRKAIYYFIPLYWIVIVATYLTPGTSENINGVFGHRALEISPALWLLLLAIAYPLLVVMPTHYLLQKVFKPAS